MEFEALWWHWMVLGLGLCLAEIAIPAFFVIWFGIGALAVGLVLLVAPPLPLAGQVLLWTLASVTMTVLWFRYFRSRQTRTRAGTANEEAIGEVGLMVQAAAPFARGQVRFQKPLFGAEVWTCIADEALEVGARVRVTGVEGSLLRVARA